MKPNLELKMDEEGDLLNPIDYRSIIGGLRYLTHTRPDVSYVLRTVSQLMEKPTIKHLQAVKHILRYIKGTINYGLTYTRGSREVIITGYTYNNLVRDINEKCNTSG